MASSASCQDAVTTAMRGRHNDPTPEPAPASSGQPAMRRAAMTGARAKAGSDVSEETLGRFFRGLGHPIRLALLDFLLDGERTVSECVEHVGLSQGRVSTHLACLARCGYVGARREGRFAFYRVTDTRVQQVVRLAEQMAAEHSEALACCPTIDTDSEHDDAE
jgi:DNA-binding transcriptional ArsR family regulator